MKRNPGSVLIDMDPWLRAMRLPYCTTGILRDMRLGEVFQLFEVYGPPIGGPEDPEPSSAHASIERVRGGYLYSAGWTLHIGNALRRGHIMTAGAFVLQRGRTLEPRGLHPWSCTPSGTLELDRFARVVRLAQRLAAMADAAGAHEDAKRIRPLMMKRSDGRCGFQVEFLDRLAAQPLTGKRKRGGPDTRTTRSAA